MLANWKLTSSLGFLFWGTWTFYVNQPAGVASALWSALLQGTISASSIASLSLGMEKAMQLDIESMFLKRMAASLVPYLMLLGIIISSHLLIGTYDIFRTVLPSSSVGVVYSFYYVNRRIGLHDERFLPAVKEQEHGA